MKTKIFTTRRIVRAAVIAALYAALTLLFAPISYIPAIGIELRVSEALTILPLFCPEAVAGLTVGCLIANLFSPNIALDLPFGTLATLIAVSLTYIIGRLIKSNWRAVIGIIPPIVVNAFIVPLIFLPLTELKELYFYNVLMVGAGQAIVLVALGLPLYFALKRIRTKIFD